MSNRVLGYFIMFIIFLNLVLRYPDLPYENGMDTFDNHARSEVLINLGFDNTILDFLSYFGLYPFSKNTGGIFLLSTFSLLTTLSISNSILLLCYSLVIFTSLSLFIFARSINKDPIFIMVVLLLFTTNRSFLEGSRWAYSFRTLFVTFLPLLFWILIKIQSTNSNSRLVRYNFFFLFLLTTVVLASIHRMFFFILVMTFVFLLALLIERFRKQTLRWNVFPSSKSFIIFSFLITILLAIIPFTKYGFYGIGLVEFGVNESQKYFLPGSDLVSSMINIAFQYSMSIGFFIILAPFGYASVLLRLKKRFIYLFLSLQLIIFTMFWSDILYAKSFFSLLIIIFVSLGILEVRNFSMKYLKRTSANIALIMLIFVGQLIPEYLVVAEQEILFEDYPDATKTDPQVYDLGMYQRHSSNNSQIGNVPFIISKVIAYSGTNTIMIPGSFVDYNLDTVSIKILLGNDVNYVYESENRFSNNLEYDVYIKGYEANDPETKLAIRNLFGDAKSFDIVITNFASGQYLSRYYNALHPIPFFENIEKETYKTYDDGLNHVRLLILV